MITRQDALAAMLTAAGYRPVSRRTARPHVDGLPPEEQDEILRLYRALGGILETPRFPAGPWDCVLEGGLVIELDEGQHFNRYRRRTLDTRWSQQLPWWREYRDYCALYEGGCAIERGWGGYWTSVSTERLFGPAGPPRILDGPGSPCWKQRAMQDAIRDIAVLGGAGVRLARLAIYDEVGDAGLDEILDGKAELDPDALRVLIDKRTLRVVRH